MSYARIAPESLGTVGPSTVPCENCTTPVSVISVSCFPGEPITRLMEAWRDDNDPLMIHLTQHTPERCRTRRAQGINMLIGEVTK